MNLNKVFILGRLTSDPQLRSTAGGQQVTSFGVATNRVWKDKAGQKQESTEFHNIVVWGRQAEVATQYLIKGSLVLVEGHLQTRSWEDKQGQPRKTTEIISESLQLGPKPMGNRPQGGFAPKGGSSIDKAPESEVPSIDISEEIKEGDIQF